MKEPMRQCELARKSAVSVHRSIRVAWIPSALANVGKVLDLRDPDGYWSRGWTVVSVHPTALPEEYVREHERDYRHQREASDI